MQEAFDESMSVLCGQTINLNNVDAKVELSFKGVTHKSTLGHGALFNLLSTCCFLLEWRAYEKMALDVKRVLKKARLLEGIEH